MNWIFILGLFLSVLVFRFLTGILMKLVIFLIIVGVGGYALFHYGIWPFDKKIESFEAIENKFCPSDPLICNCIVQTLDKDIKSRFTQEELKELDENSLKFQYVVQKSTQARQAEILSCLGEQNQAKLSEFRNAVLGAEWLNNRLNLKLEDHYENAKSKVNDVLNSKTEIDQKY